MYFTIFWKKIPVFITSTEVLDDNFLKENHEITVSINYAKIETTINLDENNILFKSEEFKILIIKINSNNNLTRNNFLEFDDNLYENNHIYILQTSGVSYGYLVKQVRQFVLYSCKVESLGAPIINLENNKVIGLTIKYEIVPYNFYLGTFLKYAVNEINKIKNQISISLEVNFFGMDNNVYFLDNFEGAENSNEIKINNFGLKELNENNVKLYINGVKYKFQKYFQPEKGGKYNIVLKFYEKIKDCSFMFYNCKNITSIDLSKFDNDKITNMNSMFCGCSSLKYIDFYSMNTKNVTDMANMFNGCNNLNNLNLFDFNTEKVTTMKKMFYDCYNIKNLNLSYFNTENVTDMSYMFYSCKKLESIDLTYFNTKNVSDMSYMFSYSEIKDLDLSSFDTKNVTNMERMFYHFKSQNVNLSFLNTEKVTNMREMFFGASITSLNLSSFNTKNVTDMSSMFMNSHNLRYVDLSSFSSDKVENIQWMFYWCNNLRKIDISNFDLNKINNKIDIFGLSSFSRINESAYSGPKNLRSVKINKNSLEEIKKQITSSYVKIIIA